MGLNNASEFAGRVFEDQLKDLEQGRGILKNFGFTPVTFIPPWHSFDGMTINALVKAGFKALSDGLFLYPRMTNGLLQLPMVFWSIPNRLTMLERINSIYTICIHPQLTTDDDLAGLERFFKDYRPSVVTAASQLEQADRLTKRSLKKTVLAAMWFRYGVP